MATQERNGLPLAAVASTFSFLSALFHFIVLVFYGKYIKDLRRGINKFRWWEYALSSSVMIMLIALLFGVWDILNLINIMAINACMNLFGLLFEEMNANNREAGIKTVDWQAFIFGCFAGIIPWVQIFAPIIASSGESNPPAFVWGILIAYAIMFNTFPINMFLQYMQVGPWDNKRYPDMTNGGYYFGEKIYQILSLVAKSLLIWLIVAGVNQPQDASDLN